MWFIGQFVNKLKELNFTINFAIRPIHLFRHQERKTNDTRKFDRHPSRGS
jgi:hypothetical protein